MNWLCKHFNVNSRLVFIIHATPLSRFNEVYKIIKKKMNSSYLYDLKYYLENVHEQNITKKESWEIENLKTLK